MKNNLNLKIGSIVEHKKFGRGEVLGFGSLGGRYVRIRYEKSGLVYPEYLEDLSSLKVIH